MHILTAISLLIVCTALAVNADDGLTKLLEQKCRVVCEQGGTTNKLLARHCTCANSGKNGIFMYGKRSENTALSDEDDRWIDVQEVKSYSAYLVWVDENIAKSEERLNKLMIFRKYLVDLLSKSDDMM